LFFIKYVFYVTSLGRNQCTDVWETSAGFNLKSSGGILSLFSLTEGSPLFVRGLASQALSRNVGDVMSLETKSRVW
jgi:hypothetical protein